MGRRRDQRVALTLPVRISGRDFNNSPFAQDCETVDISRTGCMVRWVACLRGPGDTVELQFQKEKARFKVSWIGPEGSKLEGHVGLRALENKYIFGVALPSTKLDAYVLPEAAPPPATPEPATPLSVSFEPSWAGQERRAYRRYRSAGDVEIVDVQADTKIRGMLSDISLGGCYVDLGAPLASGAAVRARITVSSVVIETRAVVRASHISMGMGLEFTEMSDKNRQRLEALVGQLAGAAPEPMAAASATPEASRYELSEADFQLAAPPSPPPAPAAALALPLPSPAQSFDNRLVLETLLQLLSSKGVLTQEEFLQALEKAASTARRE